MIGSSFKMAKQNKHLVIAKLARVTDNTVFIVSVPNTNILYTFLQCEKSQGPVW
jgi:hypothetical protein